MKKIFLLLSILLTSFIVSAQRPSEENRKKLLDLAAKLNNEYLQNQKEINEYLEGSQGARSDLPSLGVPSEFSPTGRMLYTIEHNESAAKATRTIDLYPGGKLATSITGKGMYLGVWEISSPNDAHAEFEGRLIIKDGGTEVGNHATHVSGTLIAGGVEANVRGMAYEATLHAYTAENYLSEIAEAAADGLLISSHSYGKSAGWSGGEWLGDGNISATEDWKFGIYNEEAATLDEVAFLAPYYLLIRSAGNERGEDGLGIQPPDGPYDTMTGEAIAKNILAIGNVVPQVETPSERGHLVLRPSSSWGPADDGRIKPDLTAPGTSILSSSTNESGYASLTGTSMSTPVVSGNAILLQQLHQRLYNQFMKAATLKAVLLHSALNTGSGDGPDYEYGYGFLDANFASRLINEKGKKSIIDERKLINQESYEIEVEVTDTGSPLIVSISWTDPAGVAITDAVLDPTDLALVNDLDIRVTDPNDEVTSPWILDPENPENTATTGDNFRDNYEKIEIENPVEGTYTISVTHKGELTNDEQEYTLLVSNMPRQDDQKTLYWVGESGDWNDPTKWSQTSGGVSADEIPVSGDRIIFDSLSFSNVGTVSINGNVDVSQLAWFVDNGSTLDFNGNALEVTRSFHVEGTIAGEGSQLLYSANESSTGNIFISGDNSDLTLQLSNPGTTFYLLGENIVLDELRLENGNLIARSDFSTENIVFTTSSEKEIDFGKQSVTTSNLDLGDVSLNTFLLENASIIFDGSDGLHEIKSINNFELSDVLVESGELTIVNDGLIDVLSMSSGTTLTIEDSEQLEVNNFSMEAEETNRSSVGSAGTASILSNSSNKFCLDYVDISNVSVTGSTKFVYEDNSTLTNGSGWISSPCEDVLFSEFIVTSACAKNTTFFEDISDGNPISWLWDFGDGSPTSTDQNPTHSFEEPGSYVITLSTTSETETSTFSRTIEVIESALIKPEIIFRNGTLSTEAFGPFFQWYLDGEPIEGETSRLFSSDLEEGVYQVEAFNDICSVLSDPWIPLGTDDELADFKVYPNPATDMVFVSFLSTNENVKIEIIDLGGKVMNQIQKGTVSEIPISIPVQNLDPGIYLLRVALENTFTTQKIIIEK